MSEYYQSINIIMEDSHHDSEVDKSIHSNSNSNNPKEIYVTNSNFVDEESTEATTDQTYLLKKKKKYVDTATTKKRKNADAESSSTDTMNPFGATLELRNAIRQKPCLSAYIMVSTLFFGFAVGFSVGYLASEKGYFKTRVDHVASSASTSAISNNSNSNSNSSNDLNQLTQKSIVDWGDTQLSLIERQNKVWEFLDDYIFHESSLSYFGKQEQKQVQQNPIMRFPFQGGSSQPRPIIYLNRPDAYSLLIDSLSGGGIATMSEYASDFFLISSGIDAQVNQAYCGAASAVAILNSLRFLTSRLYNGVDIPVDPVYAPYAYATQKDIFNECTQKNVISQTGGGPGVDGILTPPYGLSMPQVAGLLRCHLNTTAMTTSGIGWSVQEQYVDKSHITPGKMRFDIKNALSDPNSRVLVNYDRKAIGQVGGGHWSPVGSYSEKHDAFLILDVAKYKYPPVWIPTERLFEGLATYDECGFWNFPDAQASLTEEERTTHTKEGYTSTLAKLGCQKKLRGYITVTRT